MQTLNNEMARQDEQLAKLSKEKKGLDENLRKTQDDLQAEEDKCNHLLKQKQKLEHTIDDVRGVSRDSHLHVMFGYMFVRSVVGGQLGAGEEASW